MSVIKYTISKGEEGVGKFLERDGSALTCPFYSHTTSKEKGEASCGDWCPLFDEINQGSVHKVQLHCGSGDSEYSITEEEKKDAESKERSGK